MAKLTEFQTPTGQRGDLLRPKSLVPMILGTVVMAGVVTIGLKLFAGLQSILPGRAGSMLGGGPFNRPNQAPVQTAPQYNFFR